MPQKQSCETLLFQYCVHIIDSNVQAMGTETEMKPLYIRIVHNGTGPLIFTHPCMHACTPGIQASHMSIKSPN